MDVCGTNGINGETKTKRMKYLFYLAHPAHFHLFRNTIDELKKHGHKVIITIKSKDVLGKLLEESNHEYINVADKARKDSRIGILSGVFQRTINHLKIAWREKPDMYISTSAEFAPFCRVLGIAAVAVFEDDLILFPKYSKYLVPFLHYQICPMSCNAGKWNKHPKTIKYNANQELAYLRPSHFKPDVGKVKDIFDLNQKNFFIRFAKLTAWHDEKKTGITDELAGRIFSLLEKYGKVHLSSERELAPQFEKYRVKIKTSDVLDVLYYADLYIGDSQTMTAEAAVLGTPALRFNDFVGKLGYLEELEHKYDLTYGVPTNEPERLYAKIDELMQRDNLKEEWKLKREKMLSQTIDTTKFLVWFFENYPKSAATMKNNPDYQNNFL